MKVVRILLCIIILVLLLYFLFCFLKEAGGNDVHPSDSGSSIYDGTWHPMEGDPPSLRNRGTGSLYRDRIPMPPLRTAKGPPAPVSLGQGPHHPTRDRRSFLSNLRQRISPDDCLRVRTVNPAFGDGQNPAFTDTVIDGQTQMNPTQDEMIATAYATDAFQQATVDDVHIHGFDVPLSSLRIGRDARLQDYLANLELITQNYTPTDEYVPEGVRAANLIDDAIQRRIDLPLYYIVARFFEIPNDGYFREVTARELFRMPTRPLDNPDPRVNRVFTPDNFQDLAAEDPLILTFMRFYVQISSFDSDRTRNLLEHANNLYDFMVGDNDTYMDFFSNFRYTDQNGTQQTLPAKRPPDITNPTHPFRIYMIDNIMVELVNAIMETRMVLSLGQVTFISRNYRIS